MPDRVFAKGGRVIWVEFKATGEKPTALQAEEHKSMRAVGLDVRWYDSVEGFKADFEPVDAELDDEIAKRNGLDHPRRQEATNTPLRGLEKSKRPMPRKVARRKRSPPVEGLASPFPELEELSNVEFDAWLQQS